MACSWKSSFTFLRFCARNVAFCSSAVDLLAEWLKGLFGEDGFDGQGEVLGQRQGQLEAGAVVAALQKADGLVVHVHGVGQLLAADAALGAQDGDAVVKAALAGRFWSVVHFLKAIVM